MPSFCILSMFSLILCSLNCSYPEFSFCTTFPSFSLVFRALFARAITVLLASDYVWHSLSLSLSFERSEKVRIEKREDMHDDDDGFMVQWKARHLEGCLLFFISFKVSIKHQLEGFAILLSRAANTVSFIIHGIWQTSFFTLFFFFWIIKSTNIEKESLYWTKLKNGINLEEEFRTILQWSHHFQNNFTMIFCYLEVKKWC